MKDYNSLINSKYFMKEIKKSPFKDLGIPKPPTHYNCPPLTAKDLLNAQSYDEKFKTVIKPEILCSIPFEYKENNENNENNENKENDMDNFYKKVVEPIIKEVVEQTECELFMEAIEERAEMSNEAVFDLINKTVMLNLESRVKKELIEKSGLELYIGFDNGDTERLMLSATFNKHEGEGLTVSLSKSKDVNDFTDEKINFLIYTRIQTFRKTLVELFGFVSRDESYYDNTDFERKEKEALEEIEAKYSKWFDEDYQAKDICCFRDVYDCAGRYIAKRVDCYLWTYRDLEDAEYEEEVGEDYLMMHIKKADQIFHVKLLENTEMPCVPNYQDLLVMFDKAHDAVERIANVIRTQEIEKEEKEEEIEKYGHTLKEMLNDSDLLEEAMMRKINSHNLSTEYIEFENMDEEDEDSYGFLVYTKFENDFKIEIMNNKACINSIKDTFESLETAIDILERLM